MRAPILLMFAFVLCPAMLVGQGVYGLKQNVLDPFTEGLLLAQFDMVTGEWAEYDTLGFAEAFALGTSTFDNNIGQYVFVGAPIGGGPLSWYNFDVEGNALSAEAELTGNVHSVHHDMQQDRFFGLQGYPADSVYIDLGEVDGEPFGYWEIGGWATRLVEIEPYTAEINPVLDMPDVEAVIAGASCFDSDSGDYYFLSFGGNGVTELVCLDAVAGTVASEVDIVLGDEEAFAEIEYCIPTGEVVGLWRDLSEDGMMRLASLNLDSGVPTEIAALPQVWGFTPDGSVFDQNTNSFVLHYYDDEVNPHLLAVDVVTGEVWADCDLEGSSFLELECTNRSFAAARYGVSGLVESESQQAGLQWCDGVLRNVGPFVAHWVAVDVQGRRLASGATEPGASVDWSAADHAILLWRADRLKGSLQVHGAR